MGYLVESTKDLGGKRLSGLKGRDLSKILTSGEREVIESTSSRKTGHPVEGCYCYPTGKKTLTQNCSCLKKLQDKNGEGTKEEEGQ